MRGGDWIPIFVFRYVSHRQSGKNSQRIRSCISALLFCPCRIQKEKESSKKNPVIIRRDESFLSLRLRRKKYPGKTEKILNNPEMKADVK